MPQAVYNLLLLTALVVGPAQAGDVRDHTRPGSARDTAVTGSQAVELTLTSAEVATRVLQTWVRAAATIDTAGATLTARLCPPEAGWVRLNQRARVFPPDSKSSIYQARVTGIVAQGRCVGVTAALSGRARDKDARYVMEIVVPRGEFLSVPNEAILEEEGRQVVYLQRHPGHYIPREIRTGVRGELYTEVLHGLTEGDRVVTLGSFFIDAAHKLKATDREEMKDAHVHH